VALAERPRRGAVAVCNGKRLLAARQWCGTLGEGQQEGGEAVGELGGDAWRLGEGGARAAWHGTSAALLRDRGGAEEEERGGGCQGLSCELQKLQGPHCNTKFPTILKLK
jgi:hypothetical protein